MTAMKEQPAHPGRGNPPPPQPDQVGPEAPRERGGGGRCPGEVAPRWAQVMGWHRATLGAEGPEPRRASLGGWGREAALRGPQRGAEPSGAAGEPRGPAGACAPLYRGGGSRERRGPAPRSRDAAGGRPVPAAEPPRGRLRTVARRRGSGPARFREGFPGGLPAPRRQPSLWKRAPGPPGIPAPLGTGALRNERGSGSIRAGRAAGGGRAELGAQHRQSQVYQHRSPAAAAPGRRSREGPGAAAGRCRCCRGGPAGGPGCGAIPCPQTPDTGWLGPYF